MTPPGYILINLVYESDDQKRTIDEKQNSKISLQVLLKGALRLRYQHEIFVSFCSLSVNFQCIIIFGTHCV
jgi:hypothetical protein